MPDKYALAETITCHTWNKDKKELAISPNNNEVLVYKKTNADWELSDTLTQHDLMIKSVDWAPKTNRIVTCSVDRNAYVWTLEKGKWKPMLVLLRLNRAATFVKWSPLENKFAVGAGDKLVAICYFEDENNWWVSKHIKKPIRSTVTTVDWHPNNVLLAVGSTDYRVRVFSAYIKDIEDQPASTPWGSKMPLGQLMAEAKNSLNGGGWIHSVSFSGDGNKLCWVGHDSSINVIEASNPKNVIKLKTRYSPFLSCIWISPTTMVAAGHDYNPYIFIIQGDKIINSGKFKGPEKKSQVISAMKRFKDIDQQGSAEQINIDSIHQNSVTEITIVEGDKNNAKKIATSGVDGLLVIWNLNEVVKV